MCRVEFTANFNVRVGIDRRTCINLELIANMKTGNQKTSLFGCINFTKTVSNFTSRLTSKTHYKNSIETAGGWGAVIAQQHTATLYW